MLEVFGRYRRGVHAVARQLMRAEPGEPDGAETVVRFLRDAADLNAGRAKLGFLFDQALVRDCASHAFGLTALDVLLEFVAPIVAKDALFAKVDFAYVRELRAEFPRSEASFFGEPPEAPTGDTFGSATRFFFLVFEFVDRFLVPATKYAEALSNNVQRVTAKLKAAASEAERRALEQTVHALKVEFLLYRTALESEERAAALNRFYARYFERLLADPALPVPNHYLTDYVELQAFLANIKRGYYGSGFGAANFRLYVGVLQLTLSERSAGANPHTKAKFMELLFTLNAAEEGRLVGDLRAALREQAQLDTFVRSMLGFYAAVEFMADFQQTGSSKFRYRFFISKFLGRALDSPEYAAALKAALGTKELSDFVGHLVTDLNYFLEEAFEKIAAIRERESADAAPQDPEAATGTAAMREQVTSYLKFGRSYLRLFEQLATLCPAVFEDPQWAFKVARVLNFYAAKMCARSYRRIRLENVGRLGLKPLEFIRTLVNIYVRLGGSEALKAEIIGDERSFDTAALLDIGATAFRKKLVPEDVIGRFEELVLELEALKAQRDNLRDVVGDAPEEFLCGLTFEFMSHPVRLPGSGVVVELSAIKQHLTLNGETDPFNRQRMTLADLQELPELQARIDAWLAERKAAYRAKLREKQSLAEARAEEFSDAEDARDGDDESVGGFGAFN